MACITLLSDFGLRDPSVAIVKGIFQKYTTSPVIDISHEIIPFNIQQAAYLLSVAYKNFPEGTCHVLLFDLFSETVPKLLLSEFNGHYFLSPDNELLSLALGGLPLHTWLCYELNTDSSFLNWLNAAGNTIHLLHTKKIDFNLSDYRIKTEIKKNLVIKGKEIQCEVIHIDRYENIIINFTKQQFEALVKSRIFQLQFMQVEEINEISSDYNSVKEGYKLCRFNSDGYLEICINKGKAASLFGLRPGSKYNDVKIILE